MNEEIFTLRMAQLRQCQELLADLADSKVILALNEEMGDPLGDAEEGVAALIGALREASEALSSEAK